MTREQARKAAEIMLAYADGKDIEIAYNYKYQACPTPSFNLNSDTKQYRIKSEPKYRPFKNKDECWNEMLKHQPFGLLLSKSTLEHIHISFIKDNANYSKYFYEYTFVDGTPFRIKEE